MNCIGKELAELERSLRKFSVEALAKHLPCSWIDDALSATGHTSEPGTELARSLQDSVGGLCEPAVVPAPAFVRHGRIALSRADGGQ